MNITLFLSRFFYRIRYHLAIGSVIVTCLVAYFTQFLPKSYTVKTSIYTGIVSGSSIMEDESYSIQTVTNTFDNLINLVKTQSTYDKVGIKLLALNLVHGDLKKDNEFITAKHYENLLDIIPPDVKRLIVKGDVNATYNNLVRLQKSGGQNFVYTLLNEGYPYYSYSALGTVGIVRLQNSDLIEISYTTDDPGIATNTVKLFNEELLNSYNELRYNSTNDVIAYFEKEVAKLKAQLNQKEDVLTDYNVQNSVINYTDQTKAIAGAFSMYLDRVEDAEKRFESSRALVFQMQKQMDTRTKLFYTNKDFLKQLDDISNLNGKITEIELFTTEDAQKKNSDLYSYKSQLKDKERQIAKLTKDMDEYKYSKEGLAISELADQWIKSLIANTEAGAELKVLKERKREFDETYARYSPVGTEIKRRERDIGVTENSYLEMLHALNVAYLRKKNIQLTTSNLNTISEPSFPMSPNKSKRLLFIIAAFFGSLVFITLYKLIIELLDRTLRDGDRAQRLIGIRPIAAFVGRGELRFRGYIKYWNRKAATYLAVRINKSLNLDGTSFINVISINKGEGKSYVTNYISEEWERIGLKVKIVTLTRDDMENIDMTLATDFSSLIPVNESNDYNIVIFEFPALIENSLPKELIQKTNMNVIIINAKRVWKKSDDELITYFKDIAKDSNYALILNNADRYDVEDYTGDLPPEKHRKKFANWFLYMGLTSKKTSV